MSSNLNYYNFIIGPTDTDSFSFTKPDMASFSKIEIDSLIKELNEISPEFMVWENDGYYTHCIALKAKNYVLFDGKKKTVKGSAFKTSSKEVAMAEFMQEIVDALLQDKTPEDLVQIYHKYIKEAMTVTHKDIKRWSQKKTITEAILNCRGYTEEDIKNKIIRRNETNVWDAIVHFEKPQEGDKVYVYPVILNRQVTETTTKTGKVKTKEELSYGLKCHDVEAEIDREQLLKRVHDTISILGNVIDLELFIKYHNKKNLKLLEIL